MNGCGEGHDYVYWPMTAPLQAPCPVCKERDRANKAEADVVELIGTVEGLRAELEFARLNL